MLITATERVTPTCYSEYVNPQWVRLLGLLQIDVPYRECVGSELHRPDERFILDFLSGCVHNLGHNHPAVVAALRDQLARCRPAMLQSQVADLAGELAEGLCREAGAGLQKVFFASSGSEGAEAAIKFSRATTKRTGLIACRGAFHGLTCGALSLMDGEFWRDGFGPMLPELSTFHSTTLLHSRSVCGPNASRRFWSSRSSRRPVCGYRLKTSCARRALCAGDRGRCWFWMKCRPVCIERVRSWPGSAMALRLTW